jgi:hypothetical protein
MVAFGSYFAVISLHMENFIAALITLSEEFCRQSKPIKFRKIISPFSDVKLKSAKKLGASQTDELVSVVKT